MQGVQGPAVWAPPWPTEGMPFWRGVQDHFWLVGGGGLACTSGPLAPFGPPARLRALLPREAPAGPPCDRVPAPGALRPCTWALVGGDPT